VIISDFDALRPFAYPNKANAELIIDPNAVLPCPVALQRF